MDKDSRLSIVSREGADALQGYLRLRNIQEMLEDCPGISISEIARLLGEDEGWLRSYAERIGITGRSRKEERDRRVLEWVRANPGVSYTRAAQELGIPRYTIGVIARRSGRFVRLRHGTPRETAVLGDIREGRLIYREIAAKHGLTRHQVVGTAYRHGIRRTGYEIVVHHRGRGREVTPEQEARVVGLLKDPRMTYSQIAREAGIPNTGSISNISRRHGLLRGRGKLPPGWVGFNKGKPSPRKGIPLGPRRPKADAVPDMLGPVLEAPGPIPSGIVL
jgi:transposase-like protein